MDKKYQIVLVIGFVTAFAIMASGFTSDMFLWGSTIAVALIVVLLLLVSPMNQSGEEVIESEVLELESEALTDSRISKTVTSFIGVPFILVFGGLWGKYESMFTARYEGGAVVVLYSGMCIVSKNDKLRIIGKWDNGKKVGIKGNFVMASRIENISSGIVFDTGK